MIWTGADGFYEFLIADESQAEGYLQVLKFFDVTLSWPLPRHMWRRCFIYTGAAISRAPTFMLTRKVLKRLIIIRKNVMSDVGYRGTNNRVSVYSKSVDFIRLRHKPSRMAITFATRTFDRHESSTLLAFSITPLSDLHLQRRHDVTKQLGYNVKPSKEGNLFVLGYW